MTVSSSTRKAGPFAGNNIATVFPFNFKIFTKADVKVLRVNSTGTSTVLMLDSDYSVTLNANQNANPGGWATYPLNGAPLPSGYSLVVLGDLPYDQETDITNGGGFYPNVIEDMVDKATIQIQQLEEITSRALVITEAESTSPVLPNAQARANGTIGFDALGNIVIIPLPASVGAGDLKNEIWTAGTDYIVGTSTTVTLSRAYGTKANLGSVVMQGVAQDPSTYSLSNLTLTFLDGNGAPTPIPLGINKIWCTGGTTLSTSITPDASITDVKVAPNADVNTDKLLYTPGWLNGAPRILTSRLDDVPDIRDFWVGGAPGTGNDDTSAMTRAHANNVPIRYGAATYNFGTLVIPAGGVNGQGPSNTILVSHDQGVGDSILLTAQGELPAAGAYLFRDFLLKCDPLKTSGNGMNVNPVTFENQGSVWDNVWFYGHPTALKFTRASHWRLNACKFLAYQAVGVHVRNDNVADSGDSSIGGGTLFNTAHPGIAVFQASSGGLKLSNFKMNGGAYGYFLDIQGSTSDLIMGAGSIENMTAAAVQFSRSSGSASFSHVTLDNLQIAICLNGIAADASNSLSELTIGSGVTISLSPGTGSAVSLGAVNNFSVAQLEISGTGGTPTGLAFAAACSNGKYADPLTAGITTSVSNSSAGVFRADGKQTGSTNVTTNSADGSLFLGTAVVAFPTPYKTVPDVAIAPNSSGSGAISAFASGVTVNGFTANAIGLTNGGSVGVAWTAKGLI